MVKSKCDALLEAAVANSSHGSLHVSIGSLNLGVACSWFYDVLNLRLVVDRKAQIVEQRARDPDG